MINADNVRWPYFAQSYEGHPSFILALLTNAIFSTRVIWPATRSFGEGWRRQANEVRTALDTIMLYHLLENNKADPKRLYADAEIRELFIYWKRMKDQNK